MRQTRLFVTRWTLAFFVAMTVAATASAAPPAHAGPPGAKGLGPPGQMKHAGRPGHGRQGDPVFHGNSTDGVSVDVFFNDYRRNIIRDYYRGAFRIGHCPPGLAKKHNGCMPPGQAKKWRIGYPLPGGVIYYGLPHDLVARLGYDNPAYKLIRVGGDILRIAVGTGIVVDALQDLGGSVPDTIRYRLLLRPLQAR